MAGEMSSPVVHGRFSSALYRLIHFGRGRPNRAGHAHEFSLPRGREVEGVPLATQGPWQQATGIELSLSPHSDDAPDAELIDPLARTRAALEHARRQMPGMLGAADTEPASQLPEPAPPTLSPGDRFAAEWREALAGLKSEQARFLVEMREDRTRLLEDLEAERRSIGSAYAAERQQLIASLAAERQLQLSDSAAARDSVIDAAGRGASPVGNGSDRDAWPAGRVARSRAKPSRRPPHGDSGRCGCRPRLRTRSRRVAQRAIGEGPYEDSRFDRPRSPAR